MDTLSSPAAAPELKAPVFARLNPDDPEFERTCAREFQRIFMGKKIAFDYAGGALLAATCQAFLDDLCAGDGRQDRDRRRAQVATTSFAGEHRDGAIPGRATEGRAGEVLRRVGALHGEVLMGTNFFFGEARLYDDDDHYLERHIGKRSAAGLYCWDCQRTLCPGGNAFVHRGGRGTPEWPTVCSQCGAKHAPTGPWTKGNPAAVELGLAKSNDRKPSGIAGAASFSWAIAPTDIRERIYADPEISVVDEYGRKMTGHEFLEMVDINCPIQFTDFVGRVFS